MDRGPIYTDRIFTFADAAQYYVHFYGNVFSVVVTSQASGVRRWMSEVFWRFMQINPLLQNQQLLASLSLLWPGDPLLDEDVHRPAIIQICVGHLCLVFQVALAGHNIPSPIPEFLEDDRIIFHGWSNLSEHRRLQQHYGVWVRNQRRLLLPVDNDRRLMIEQEVLQQTGCTVRFPEAVYRSHWDAPELSIDQVQYAGLEAWLAYQVALMRSF